MTAKIQVSGFILKNVTWAVSPSFIIHDVIHCFQSFYNKKEYDSNKSNTGQSIQHCISNEISSETTNLSMTAERQKKVHLRSHKSPRSPHPLYSNYEGGRRISRMRARAHRM